MALHRGDMFKKKSVEITDLSPLVVEDLEILREKRPKTFLKNLRDPHHNLARLLAAGVSQKEAGLRSGYSYNRVAMMKVDPAFQELIEYYRKLVTQTWLESLDDYMELATSNMMKAEKQLAEKLEEAELEGETLPTRDLIAISRDAADRFGYGKKSTNVNVNVDFAAKLERAIQRSSSVIDNVVPLAPVGSSHYSPRSSLNSGAALLPTPSQVALGPQAESPRPSIRRRA